MLCCGVVWCGVSGGVSSGVSSGVMWRGVSSGVMWCGVSSGVMWYNNQTAQRMQSPHTCSLSHTNTHAPNFLPLPATQCGKMHYIGAMLNHYYISHDHGTSAQPHSTENLTNDKLPINAYAYSAITIQS